MKYRIFAIMCVLICFLIGGCGFWMDGEYLSVTPHQERVPQVGTDVIEVSNYTQLQNALAELTESGAESGVVSASSFNSATAHHYVNRAVNHVMSNNPVATYAVEKITFEIGTNRRAAVIAFQIDYRHGRSEILQIKQTSSMEEATTLITNALDNHENSVVLRIKQYNDTDIVQLVQNYANQYTDRVMETPHVSAALYPEKGNDRIIVLTFTYQTDRDDLRDMQEQVEAVFTSAELYVKKTTQVSDIYSQLYSFLMERNEYTVKTSITPSYSLLYHGVGDARAFANVYAAMCRRAELDCQVVSGTRDGIAWCWNVVRFRGKYYHVDLLSCRERGAFQMHEPSEMKGYVWDYSNFPKE